MPKAPRKTLAATAATKHSKMSVLSRVEKTAVVRLKVSDSQEGHVKPPVAQGGRVELPISCDPPEISELCLGLDIKNFEKTSILIRAGLDHLINGHVDDIILPRRVMELAIKNNIGFYPELDGMEGLDHVSIALCTVDVLPAARVHTDTTASVLPRHQCDWWGVIHRTTSDMLCAVNRWCDLPISNNIIIGYFVFYLLGFSNSSSPNPVTTFVEAGIKISGGNDFDRPDMPPFYRAIHIARTVVLNYRNFNGGSRSTQLLNLEDPIHDYRIVEPMVTFSKKKESRSEKWASCTYPRCLNQWALYAASVSTYLDGGQTMRYSPIGHKEILDGFRVAVGLEWKLKEISENRDKRSQQSVLAMVTVLGSFALETVGRCPQNGYQKESQVHQSYSQEQHTDDSCGYYDQLKLPQLLQNEDRRVIQQENQQELHQEDSRRKKGYLQEMQNQDSRVGQHENAQDLHQADSYRKQEHLQELQNKDPRVSQHEDKLQPQNDPSGTRLPETDLQTEIVMESAPLNDTSVNDPVTPSGTRPLETDLEPGIMMESAPLNGTLANDPVTPAKKAPGRPPKINLENGFKRYKTIASVPAELWVAAAKAGVKRCSGCFEWKDEKREFHHTKKICIDCEFKAVEQEAKARSSRKIHKKPRGRPRKSSRVQPYILKDHERKGTTPSRSPADSECAKTD